MNLLKRIICKVVQWYFQMAKSLERPKGRTSSVEAKKKLCSPEHNLSERSSNYVHIKIPGKRAYHCINVKDGENVSSLKTRMAKRLGVDTKNWGIYAADRNEAPKIVDDEKKISQIDHNRNLFFYPRIIIR